MDNFIRELFNDGTEDSIKMAKSLMARQRFFAVVVEKKRWRAIKYASAYFLFIIGNREKKYYFAIPEKHLKSDQNLLKNIRENVDL